MQFRLSPGSKFDTATLASALKPLDSQAQIVLDPYGSVLEVISSVSADKIVHALAQLGCQAKLLEKVVHVSGGSSCCGSCG